MNKKLITVLVALLGIAGLAQAETLKREFRSTWLTTVWRIDWPESTTQSKAKAQMTEYLDNLQAHNYTGVCFQVRSLADAMYKSSYEPWSAAISGTRGTNPGWDPLEWVVAECHSRGMECYAWINPFRESSSGTAYTTSYDKEWSNNGWLLSNGSYIVFNPGIAEARAHILKVIKEIYTNYAVDGIVFDDYFYPSGGTEEGSSAPDYAIYKASGTSLSIGDWRRKNVNDFVQEVYDNIQADRPDLRFGISPAGIAGASASTYGLSKPNVTAGDWQYAEIYSDPLAWLNAGSVDFISPQIYWTTTASASPFGPISKWWSMVGDHFGRHFYVSHSISFLASANTSSNWAEVGKQVDLHRQYQATYNADPGSIYYSTKNIDGLNGGVAGLGDYLEQNKYTGKTLVPVITWKEHPTYAAPANFKLSSGTLSWSATAGAASNSIIRYTVYAIPSDVTFEDAQSADGDGIDISYLLGVTYGTSYTLPTDRKTGYYYAVCVYDGYGYESEAALANYTQDPSQATTLVSPAAGATVEWTATFSWTSVANATYRLEISDAPAFSNILVSKAGITGTSTTVELNTLSPNTSYYWRVVTTQSGCAPTASGARSFKTGDREVGNIEAGYSIKTDVDAYLSTENFVINSVWYRSAQSSYDNFTYTENGVLNRGMVATEDYVYVSGRTAGSAEADIYLQVYDASTGEHMDDLFLSADGKCNYLPCNDVIKDTAGNICITNLTLNITTTPLKVYKVDVTNGNLTLVAELTGSTKARIDHAAIYGDVTSSQFYVFAASSSDKIVYRWTVKNGSVTESSVTLSELLPSSAANIGIAAKVFPINADQFYLDGGNTGAALYSFSTGKIVDKPATTAAHYVSDTQSNGFDRVTINDYTLYVYAAASHAGSGYQFNVVEGGATNALSDGKLLWTIPNATLGSTNSTTLSAPVSIVKVGETAMVYIYVPGNGLAAYCISKSPSVVSDIAVEMPRVAVYGSVVTFGSSQDFVKVYNLAGTLVANATDAAEVSLPDTGVYVVVTPAGAFKVAIR